MKRLLGIILLLVALIAGSLWISSLEVPDMSPQEFKEKVQEQTK